MDLDFYQKEAGHFARYPEAGTGSPMALAYVALGLGESGEAQGKVKKILRDDGGQVTDEARDAIVAELGDILWYIAATAWELDVPLSEVARINVDKLSSREQRGVIGGSGDYR